MKYIIYTDVDGTLYPRTKLIHNNNLIAISKAQNLDIEIIISTGNGPFSVMKNLAKTLNVKYLITSNGAGILDVKNNTFLFKNMIPKNIVQQLKEFALSQNIDSSAWDDRYFYTSTKNDYIIETIKNVMMGDQELKHLSSIDSDVFKFESYGEPAKIDLIEIEAKKMGLQCARMRSEMVEITNQNVNKGSAVKWLNNFLNIEQNNFMTIGDSANDHSMLKISDFSYAMANADDETKSIAKFHTSAVEQGGLAEAIEDFIYRKKIDI